MAVCDWCDREMLSADSCTVDAFHVHGRRLEMIRFGHEEGWGPSTRGKCGDCGVAKGQLHHPGCDVQRCPSCPGQLMWCGCEFDEDGPAEPDVNERTPLGVDANGCLTERFTLDTDECIVHYDDVPQGDITTVRGIPCTTALRTVIDLAPELDRADLVRTVFDCLARRLFTVEDANHRLNQPDMADRAGAELLRRVLPDEV